MKKRIKLCLLFGGKSSEHDVSILSAKSVLVNLDRKKYEILLVYVDREGRWWKVEDIDIKSKKAVMFLPGSKGVLRRIESSEELKIDVVFPVLHGGDGENGNLQGYLEIAGVPYVGNKLISSAVALDKNLTRILVQKENIKSVDYLVIENKEINFEYVKNKFGCPFFIKPNSQGSSIGISKVTNEKEFLISIKKAWEFDKKVLVERYCKGREIELSVLGNNEIRVSVAGEVKVGNGWYDFENKYYSDNVELDIPAKLDRDEVIAVQKLATKVFKTIGCTGLARVDFYFEKGNWIFNEINTMPGFTKNSMYPKLWEASGVSYSELLEKIIKLALD